MAPRKTGNPEMPWIQSHTEQENSPKIFEFRHLMGWDKNTATGFLHRFRWQVILMAPNGDIAPLRPAILAEVLGMDPELIVKALEAMESPAVGLLRRVGDHLLVNDWLVYVGRYLKESLWKRHPERVAEAERIHGQSVDSPKPPPASAEDKGKRFVPPTVEEVAAYCAERNNSGRRARIAA